MELRKYRVIGTATYLTRNGDVCRIHVNATCEAPDEVLAPTMMLAQIEVRKGADASYDPEARWEVGQPPEVQDETAKENAIAASGLEIGGGVQRKTGKADRGIVRQLYTVSHRGALRVRAAVDWPAPRRIGGDGWHRSDVLATSLRGAE